MRIRVDRPAWIAGVGGVVLSLCGAACAGKDQRPAVGDSSSVAAPAPAAATSDAKATDAKGTDATDPSAPQTPLGRTGAIEFYPAIDLSNIAAQLAKGTTTAKTVVAHPTFHYVQARRSANGVPEIHDRWIDVTIVQSGRANLLVGGRVSGSRLASPGEHRGGTIVGGATRPIAAGDLFTIPAGVPHQYMISAGDSVRYLTIKVLQPGGP